MAFPMLLLPLLEWLSNAYLKYGSVPPAEKWKLLLNPL